MFSIEKRIFDISRLTQSVLTTIEDVCDQFGLNKDFGYITLSSQIIAEYLLATNTKLSVSFSVYVDSEKLSLIYSADKASFRNFLIEFNEIEELRLLSDFIEVSRDNKTLVLDFHVKPRPNYLNQTRLKKIIYQNTPLI